MKLFLGEGMPEPDHLLVKHLKWDRNPGNMISAPLKSGYLLFGICILVPIGVGLTILQASWKMLSAGSVLVALAAVWVIRMAFIADWRHNLLLWWSSVFFLLGYPIAIIGFTTGLAAYTPMLPSDLNSLILAFQIGSVGWFLWLWGYILTVSGRGVLQHRSEQGAYIRWRLIIMAAIGFAGAGMTNLFLFSHEGKELFSRTGILFSICAFFGLAAALCLTEAKTKTSRAVALMALMGFALFGVTTGMRGGTVNVVKRYMAFIMFQRRMKNKPIRSILILFAFMTVAFGGLYPLLTAHKSAMGEVREEISGVERVSVAFKSIISAYEHRLYDAPEGYARILTRMSDVQYTAALATWGLSEWGWLRGKSLIDSLIAFVPRFLWPDKPTIGLGQGLYEVLGFRAGTGSATVPLAADWYINFGWIGIVLGMPAMGIIYATINRWLGEGDIFLRASLACLTFNLSQASLGIAGVMSDCLIFGVGSMLLRTLLITNDYAGKSI